MAADLPREVFGFMTFYQKDHTLKEAADFLKKEYGTGGSSHALAGSDKSHKDYDAKGISLKKGKHLYTGCGSAFIMECGCKAN